MSGACSLPDCALKYTAKCSGCRYSEAVYQKAHCKEHKRGKMSEVAELLVERGADVNAKVPNGDTALIVACITEHSEVATMLVKRGRGVSAKDDGVFQSVFMTACDKVVSEVSTLLVREFSAAGSPKSSSFLRVCFQTSLFGYNFFYRLRYHLSRIACVVWGSGIEATVTRACVQMLCGLALMRARASANKGPGCVCGTVSCTVDLLTSTVQSDAFMCGASRTALISS